MDVIQINRFKSQQDNRVSPLPPGSWSVIAQFFLDSHLQVESKQDAPLFNGVLYKRLDEVAPTSGDWGTDERSGSSYVKRRKSNIKQVQLLILDYDDGMSIEEAKSRFAEYEHIGYTSYNHLVKGGIEKFRLVFPLKTSIPAWIHKDESGREVAWGEWYYLREALETFAGDCDPASFNANQIFFVPSVHPDNAHFAEVWHNTGQLLDWEQFTRSTEVVRTGKVGRPVSSTGARTVSEFALRPDDVLDTAEGPIRVQDIHRRYQGVVCPAHGDTQGSEFADRSPTNGRVYVVCKHCGTLWEVPESPVATLAINGISDTKTQKEVVDDLLGLPPVDYVDAEDRSLVIRQLAEIADSILADRKPVSDVPRSVVHRSHIVYLPEGAGKSRLAVDFAKRGKKVVFACKSWSQAFEKYEDFKAMGLQYQFSVQLFASKEGKARRRFGVPVVRDEPRDPFSTGKILDEESIAAFIKANPKLNPDFIRLSWQFFSADVLSFEQLPSPIFDKEGRLVEESKGGDYVSEDVNILVTTFAQLRILKLKGQELPGDWLVWVDDPDISDVIDIDPYDPELWPELTEEQLKSKTRLINGKPYYRRRPEQSLGYAQRFHKCVYTTTEVLTRDAIALMMCRRNEEYVVHDKMTHLAGGKITILGTMRVHKRFDGVVPLVTRRLNKQGFSTVLIADGLSSDVNHSSSKGKNTLNKTNILVELSVPHPVQVRTLCDALDKSFDSEQHEVTQLLMLDRMHQAIGRNSGYRYQGDHECVVLADRNFHKYLVDNARYKLDAENSVIIDRTKAMSRKERRTGKTASPMVLEIEALLNNLDSYLLDKRKSRPDINHVVKHVTDESKRRKLIVRILLALTAMSGVRFDSMKDSPDQVGTRTVGYSELGFWLIKNWVDREGLESVVREYKRDVDLLDI